ncbi:MAG: bacillithiol biosynthesis cysteine-adding enzyme BshC [Chitinophagaceae bacterium]|nr:MAG: bacillithiol biosynthesis cysteine-adding enzyme BshC [Chitinophagaceae bacterium]
MKDCNGCIDYKETHYFSKIVVDYLNHAEPLQDFISFTNDLEGIKNAIESRKINTVDRKLLVEGLKNQYKNYEASPVTMDNIEALLNDNTFTIITAHQPNILTGHLYFIYKILHTIKLSAFCKAHFPDYHFVPVFFMGSEDADLDELNHIYADGKKYTWETNQKGAVGRMLIDKAFVKMVDELKNQVEVLPFGDDIISLIQEHYTLGKKIDIATASFVNAIFSKFGLVILIPDDALLKSAALSIFKKEILLSPSKALVENQNKKLTDAGYKSQAYARDINLFYLKENARNRIERNGDIWNIVDTDIQFTTPQIEAELEKYPERFSPNVILRGVFQEAILPNIAFIGGGGELAYWLQLKPVFEYFNIFYPVLVLRNSFLLIEEKSAVNAAKLGLSLKELFLKTDDLVDAQIKKNTKNPLSINSSIETLATVFDNLKDQVVTVDPTLLDHVSRLHKMAIGNLNHLEHKILKAEKRNQNDRVQQIQQLKSRLFPMNSLQERIENVIPFWSRYGKEWIDIIYHQSLSLEQQFAVINLSNQTDL